VAVLTADGRRLFDGEVYSTNVSAFAGGESVFHLT
jgi:hypothetical protein